MKNCNKRRHILKQIDGVVERVQARADARRAYRRYAKIRNMVRTGELPTYETLTQYLRIHYIQYTDKQEFGFHTVQIGTFPALVFNKHGHYAGRQFTYVTPHKKVESTENLLDNISRC